MMDRRLPFQCSQCSRASFEAMVDCINQPALRCPYTLVHTRKFFNFMPVSSVQSRIVLAILGTSVVVLAIFSGWLMRFTDDLVTSHVAMMTLLFTLGVIAMIGPMGVVSMMRHARFVDEDTGV